MLHVCNERAKISAACIGSDNDPALAAFATFGAFVWIVPITNTVTAPAILRASQEHAVYAPFPARIVAVKVADRDEVGAEA